MRRKWSIFRGEPPQKSTRISNAAASIFHSGTIQQQCRIRPISALPGSASGLKLANSARYHSVRHRNFAVRRASYGVRQCKTESSPASDTVLHPSHQSPSDPTPTRRLGESGKSEFPSDLQEPTRGGQTTGHHRSRPQTPNSRWSDHSPTSAPCRKNSRPETPTGLPQRGS